MLSGKKKLFALTVFFFSGFSALIYEIIWARLLTLVFGTSIEAISAVITAFMFGLAFGSYFAGRHSDYIRKYLLAYAITEFLIGVSSIILYFTIINLPSLLNSLQEGLIVDHGYIVVPIVYLLNFLLVAVPTTLMGATFPLISMYFVRKERTVGLGLGILYGVNTLGAVLGTFICGFFLIPGIGVRETNLLAAIISISLGIISFAAGRGDRRKSLFSQYRPAVRSNPGFDPLGDKKVLTVLLIFFSTGFAAMAYEVTWTRLLVMVIGNSTYAFSSILTVFLAGIALGSFILARYVDRVKDLIFFFGIVELTIFLFVASTLPFLDGLPFLFQFLFNNLYSGFASLELITFMIVTLLIFIPTMLMGASFPLVNRIIISRLGFLGRSVGVTYSANTIGGIFGAFLAGFYYIPEFGAEKTLLLISSLNLFAGLALIIQTNSVTNFGKMAAIVLSGVIFANYANWLPEWNKNYLNRGVYVYADWYGNNFKSVSTDLKNFFDERYNLKWYKEGRIGTVAVTDIRGQLGLQVNGKTEGSTGKEDMKTQIMVSALPLTLNGTAEKVAIVGLGTGISLGVAEQFPVREIDCIEISRNVVRANRYFRDFNHDAVNDPRINLIPNDGRNYLTYTNKKYDVIINEPSNPWITGVSNLFTLEFFEIASKRLREGGVMSQWIQLYSLKTEELKILLHTFKKVFPNVSVWMFSPSDLIVLGSKDSTVKHFSNTEQAFYVSPLLYEDLRSIDIHSPSDIMRGYLFGTEKAAIFADKTPFNTDNYPIVEFQAPKSLFMTFTTRENIEALLNCC